MLVAGGHSGGCAPVCCGGFCECASAFALLRACKDCTAVAWGYIVLVIGMEGSADGQVVCVRLGEEGGRRSRSVLHLFGAGGWRAPGVVGAFICLVARRPAQLQALPGVRGVCMECIMAPRLRHTACTLMGLSGCMMLVVGEYGRVCWGSGDESLQTC